MKIIRTANYKKAQIDTHTTETFDRVKNILTVLNARLGTDINVVPAGFEDDYPVWSLTMSQSGNVPPEIVANINKISKMGYEDVAGIVDIMLENVSKYGTLVPPEDKQLRLWEEDEFLRKFPPVD